MTSLYPQIQEAKKNAVMSGSCVELKNVLEQAVIASLNEQNEELFAVNYAQLEKLYLDTNCITFTDNEKLCVGVGLMKYLRDDNLSAFHILLQHIKFALDKKGLGNSLADEDPAWACFTFPMSLEREIVTGNMTGVLEATRDLNKLPHPLYQYFTIALEKSMRSRVCKAIELAYQKIPVSAAMELLGMSSEDELMRFTETKMSEVWETSLRKPKIERFGSLATPQHMPAVPRESKGEEKLPNSGLARTSSITHKSLHHKMSGTRVTEETIVFESKEPPKLWTISSDRKYVEIIDVRMVK